MCFPFRYWNYLRVIANENVLQDHVLVDNNLKCTDACTLRDCKNTSTGDDIDDDSESDLM